MFYQEYSPEGPLQPFIAKLWYCQADELVSENISVPLLQHELVINFSDRHSIERAGKEEKAGLASWINGLQSGPSVSRSTGAHEMMGILFNINGLQAFTRESSREFRDSYFDPRDVFGSSFEELVDRIYQEKTPSKKLQLLETFLVLQRKESGGPAYIRHCLNIIANESENEVLVNQLCKELKISNKSLVAAFTRYVGTTPLQLIHLNRINRALHLIAKDPSCSLTQLAFELHYADQAHFSRSFRSWVGMSPSAYAQAASRDLVDGSMPNYIFLDEGKKDSSDSYSQGSPL